jgi:hypothetical protein
MVPASGGQGFMLITRLHVTPMLRMSGTILLLPQYTFMAWAGTTLPLLLLLVVVVVWSLSSSPHRITGYSLHDAISLTLGLKSFTRSASDIALRDLSASRPALLSQRPPSAVPHCSVYWSCLERQQVLTPLIVSITFVVTLLVGCTCRYNNYYYYYYGNIVIIITQAMWCDVWAGFIRFGEGPVTWLLWARWSCHCASHEGIEGKQRYSSTHA